MILGENMINQYTLFQVQNFIGNEKSLITYFRKQNRIFLRQWMKMNEQQKSEYIKKYDDDLMSNQSDKNYIDGINEISFKKFTII